MGLCENCKKSQATFHLTNIDKSGEKVERHLCDRCAVSEGLVQIHKPTAFNETLENVIAGDQRGQAAARQLVCESCGLSYLEFRNQGLLGCPQDYDQFCEFLATLVERAQDGASHHVGKSPAASGAQMSARQDISKLRRQLDDAVAAEDYERAAELRDRMRDLSGE